MIVYKFIYNLKNNLLSLHFKLNHFHNAKTYRSIVAFS